MKEQPDMPPADPQDKIGRAELIISRLLRVGMLTSLSIVAIGVALMFVHHPDYMQSPKALEPLRHGENVFPTTLGDVFRGAIAGQGRSVVLLGVFALFLTPVLRVATSIVTFMIERDWKFAVITSCVLLFLVLSLVLGKAG